MMKRVATVIALLQTMTLTATMSARQEGAGRPRPPVAPTVPHVTELHGTTLTDDYFWLRDKTNPQVMDYLKAEDAYSDAIMRPTAGLQESLYREILSHIKQTDDTVPYREGNFFYYSRTREGQQYPIYCRKRRTLTAPEEVILDQNELAKGQSYFAIGERTVSDDGNLLAYSVDTTGYRQYTLRIKDLRTGMLHPEAIERVTSVVWAADNRTIFYVTEDPVTKRSDKFFRHGLGTTVSELLFQERDELFDLAAYRSRDNAMIFLQSFSKTSTETQYIPAGRPTDALKMVLPRQKDHEYDVDYGRGTFYIRTNKGATNFRVVTAPVANPAEREWKEFIAHRPAVKVSGLDVFASHVVLSLWERGLQHLEIVDLARGTRRRISHPEPVYAVSLGPNRDFQSMVLRYHYQSLVTPSSVLDYDLRTGKSTLLKETEVPGGFTRTNYASERVFATASDGTRIPVSMVYRKGVPRDGTAPLLLYAYGSYGASTPPTFSSSRLPLLDRGVIYAIAHIRGGGELGEDWREQGRMMKKMNTFTDFIASAEYLVTQKYTSPGRLVIQGGSAGGLLVGAVVNMRPELFNAAIAQVPFVDVINTMLDASLPLTTSEYIEWGNPNDKPAFDYMIKYSPYDNVRRQAYPAMLVKVSVNDSQVPYWEGAKLVAKLRTTKTDANPLILKVNFGAGHGGASGRYDALRETAFNYAFALWQMGIGGS